MNDAEFLDAFHRGNLSSDEFRHRGHLRLAWLVLSDHRTDEAARIVAREIKRFAAAQGAAGRYHETLARFWIHLVSHATQNARGVKNVDELLARFPLLLDKNLPYFHWRRESINSEREWPRSNRTSCNFRSDVPHHPVMITEKFKLSFASLQ